MIDFEIRVIIVDDQSFMRITIKKYIKEIGFISVDTANDGAEALIKLKNGSYGLIISDWNIPNMSGLELLKNVRKDLKLKDIPFLMITSKAGYDEVREAIKAGVSNFIVKPFSVDTLSEKINTIFKPALTK